MLDALRAEMQGSEQHIRARLASGTASEAERAAYRRLAAAKRAAWTDAGGDAEAFPLADLERELAGAPEKPKRGKRG